MTAGAGKSGLTYNYIILKDRARVELYIDTGDAEENKRIFDALHTHKEEIETAFGAPLDWQRLEGRRASRISYHLSDGGLANRERWPEIQDAMIDAMIRLEKAFSPYIRKLRT